MLQNLMCTYQISKRRVYQITSVCILGLYMMYASLPYSLASLVLDHTATASILKTLQSATTVSCTFRTHTL